MPKRGKKGAVAEDGEEPKIGKTVKGAPLPRACDGGASIYPINGRHGRRTTFLQFEELAATAGSHWAYS